MRFYFWVGEVDRKYFYRLSNSFETVCAFASEPHRKIAARQIAKYPRGKDTTRLSRRLQTGSNVDAIAEDVVTLDNDVTGM